jgi:hypothetical protein
MIHKLINSLTVVRIIKLTEMWAKLFGNFSDDFDIIEQLLIRYSVFILYWRKKWEYNGTVHQLFIDSEKVYDPVRREVWYCH